MCRYLPTQDTLFVEPARLCTDGSSNQPLAPPPPFPPSVWSSFLWCLWKRQTVVLSSTAAASSIATPTRPMRGNMMMTMMVLVVTTSSPNSNRTATKALSVRNLSDSSLNLDIHVQLIYKVQPPLGYVAEIFVWPQSEAGLEPRMLCGCSGTSIQAFLNGSFKIRGKLRVPRELIRSILH